MSFKLVEIVGEEAFRKIEWRIFDHECKSFIYISSEKICGCTERTYHLPFYGDIQVNAKNSFEAMRSLSSFLGYMK